MKKKLKLKQIPHTIHAKFILFTTYKVVKLFQQVLLDYF